MTQYFKEFKYSPENGQNTARVQGRDSVALVGLAIVIEPRDQDDTMTPNLTMTSYQTPALKGNKKADNELLAKGIMCALIGLGVLISPRFMAPSPFSATVAGASLIGWFALVLGCALGALYARRRMAAERRNDTAMH